MVLENKLRETVNEYDMIKEGDRVLVALSGGADSVSLLISLNNLKRVLKIEYLAACHLNHGLRKTADRDMEFCKDICKSIGVDFFSKKIDITSYAKKLKTCEEEAGRKARYDFFEELKKTKNFTKIATAHNMNDQAETFLMRIISGTSLEGLTSIKPVREDNVIRPLIKIKRDEIEEYLKLQNINYMTDETNLSDIYKRNSIRLNLIPYIKENYNPNIVKTLSAMAEELTRDNLFIQKETEKARLKIRSFPVNADDLSSFDDSLKIRIISDLCKVSLNKNAKEGLLKFIKSKKNNSCFHVSKDITLVYEYGKVFIKPDTGLKSYIYKLEPGVNYIPEIDGRVVVSEGESFEKNSVNVSSLDNLYVRTRRNGDKIYLKGICGHKKIKDIFIDKKIPAELREIWPIITEGEKIVWLTGIYKNENPDKKYNIIVEWRNSNV